MKRTSTPQRTALILEHLHLVDKAVMSFLNRNPEFLHLEEDLRSEGNARVVDTIDRYLNGKVNNLKAYLRLSIRSGLWEAARTDDVIQSPRNCSARQCRGQELSSYSTLGETLPDIDAEPFLASVCVDKHGILKSTELWPFSCDDEIDILIVRMLRSGATLDNITDELSLSVDEVIDRGQKIGKRLLELL